MFGVGREIAHRYAHQARHAPNVGGFLATFSAWLPTTPDGMRWGILVYRENGPELYYPMAYSMAFGAVLYAAAWLIGFFVGGGRPRQLRRLLGTRRHPSRPLAEMICYTVSGAAAGGCRRPGHCALPALVGSGGKPRGRGYRAVPVPRL